MLETIMTNAQALVEQPAFVLVTAFCMLVALQAERRWVRARRRMGRRTSLLALVLDTLVIAFAALCSLGLVHAMILPLWQQIGVTILAPLLWLLGLVVILVVGIILIWRLGPARERYQP